MPHLTTDDGVRLYYEETGSGAPVVLVHEFADDVRGYEPQVRYFGRRYRCIAFNARGYPPSDVPEDPARYSQERARDDIRAVLDGLGIAKAHVVGISMGGFAVLHFGLSYPDRALSLVVAGCGYGAEPGKRQQFHDETAKTAELIAGAGMAAASKTYAIGPTRVQFQNKDPRGWAEFAAHLAEHSTLGSANTMRGVQARRPSLYDLTDRMRALDVPTLVMTGDEDDPCLEPGLLMKRTIPTAALIVFPNTGHGLNLEEPELFNRTLDEFFHQVESGRWPRRDPRSQTGSILGVRSARNPWQDGRLSTAGTSQLSRETLLLIPCRMQQAQRHSSTRGWSCIAAAYRPKGIPDAENHPRHDPADRDHRLLSAPACGSTRSLGGPLVQGGAGRLAVPRAVSRRGRRGDQRAGGGRARHRHRRRQPLRPRGRRQVVVLLSDRAAGRHPRPPFDLARLDGPPRPAARPYPVGGAGGLSAGGRHREIEPRAARIRRALADRPAPHRPPGQVRRDLRAGAGRACCGTSTTPTTRRWCSTSATS